MSAHTPGPWVCRPTIGPGDELLEAIISKSAGNVTVATDCIPDDANLIAAAPDMLEALRKAHLVTCPTVDHVTHLCGGCSISAVIAKAEGRQE